MTASGGLRTLAANLNFRPKPFPMVTVPDPAAALDVRMDDGAVIRLRRHGNAAGPRIVLSHGNGCAIDGYFAYWGLLLADFDVVLFDFRNCGTNPVHDGAHGYARFLKDLTAIYDAIDAAFGRKPQIGAFHSMSSRANLKYALDGNRRLDGLILFDPPMVPPADHPLHARMYGEERALWRWAESRPDRFDDPAELAALYAKSRMLAGWVDGAYETMARAVLHREADTGQWVLTCSGVREAQVYRENAGLNMWPQAAAFPMPVLTIASDPGSGIPSAPGHACRALRDECGWAYECVPGTGHFLQIQEPGACAALTRRFVVGIGLA